MQLGTTTTPAPLTRDTDTSNSDDWLAAVHHTGGWRGTGLFFLVAAAVFWGATEVRGQYAVGAAVIAVTVVLYGLWLSWDYLTAFLLNDFSGHRERSALATAIGMYRPDIGDRIVNAIGATADAETSKTAERPSIEDRLPADSDVWLASSFTPTLPAQIVRHLPLVAADRDADCCVRAVHE